MTLARAGRYDESLACMAPKIGEPEAHCLIGRMLHHLHQDDAARTQAELALKDNPNLQAAQDLLAAVNTPGSAAAMAAPDATE